MKICPRCKKEQKDNEFHVDNRTGKLTGRCNTCERERRSECAHNHTMGLTPLEIIARRSKRTRWRRNWMKSNPERAKANRAAWIKNNPEKARLMQRKAALKLNYKISIEDYNQIAEKQNYKCAICGGPPRARAGVFDIDHCHKTGKIRGLLCQTCNRGLGQFMEKAATLRAATEYLYRFEEQNVEYFL